MVPTNSILACSASLLLPLFDVLIVQHGATFGTFPNVQTACDHAQERDTILIKAGTYPQFEVVDKWLTISADTGASVAITGGISVRDLEPGKRVTLIGLTSQGAPTGSPGYRNGLTLESNQGAIRISNCQFHGTYGTQWYEPGGDGVHVDQCSDTALSHCTSIGGLSGIGYAGVGGSGLRLLQSSAAAYDCTLRGGNGLDSQPGWAADDAGIGGDACHSESSQLFASHTSFRGGDGGDFGLLPLGGETFGGAGGNGLFQSGANGIARLVSPTAVGGAGGQNPPTWGFASPGQPLFGNPILTLSATYREMTVAADPIRESTSLLLSMTGRPGDRVGLIVSPIASPAVFNASWNGQQLFPAGSSFLRFGTIPAGSMLAHNLPFADLGPGVQAKTFQLQALFSGLDGVRVLGTPVSLLVLDSAY